MSRTTYIHNAEEGIPCACDNCDWTGDASETVGVTDLNDRINPGCIVPVGQCPEHGCGALVYYLDEAAPDYTAQRKLFDLRNRPKIEVHTLSYDYVGATGAEVFLDQDDMDAHVEVLLDGLPDRAALGLKPDCSPWEWWQKLVSTGQNGKLLHITDDVQELDLPRS